LRSNIVIRSIMLVQLTISNFAIISHLEIDFKPGLNILSGETGAGKSIIMNAVNLILGGRATMDLIRSGTKEARVEALFVLPENSPLTEVISEMGVPFNGELLIRRSISREGRNRIMINGSIGTIQMLSRLGIMMISISGQHEHQLLLKPDNHLFLLDDFGGLTSERITLNESFREYETMLASRRRLENEIREAKEKKELTSFQIREIEAAKIRVGEEDILEEEKKRLRYAEQLKEIIGESYQTLYERDSSVISELSLIAKSMERGREMDKRLEGVRKALLSAEAELEDVGLELRNLQDNIMIDPLRLEEVEERLQILNKLKRKYGSSLEDILQYREKLSGLMDNMDLNEKKLEELNKRLDRKRIEIISKATELSKKRKSAAERFEKSVEDELALLDMGGTRFEVRFHHDGYTVGSDTQEQMEAIKADGFDRIEFMLSPNIGEELKPLSKIASGGELSRIMLALKTILARQGSVETVIFDEVDSGIGGATAEVVGEKLWALAQYHQILCITHLPQIASKGEAHFLVEKRIEKNRTNTIISELDPGGRIKEIARLLGGRVISEQAIAHAREMLQCTIIH
jgi:DNA repair protein RecN (Recombination protein N)